MSGTLVLAGSPPLTIPAGAQTGAVATSDPSGDAGWQCPWGTRPESYGAIGAGNDGGVINAAIADVAAGNAPGPVVLTGAYALEQTVVVLPGVNLAGNGQGNRLNFPDTFTGGYLRPIDGFASSTPLVQIGTAVSVSHTAASNPCGTWLNGICLSGLTTGLVNITGCTGLAVTDTADVHLTNCFFANFDRGGATGTCVSLSSGTAGNGVGFEATNCLFGSSWRGIYGDGAGVSDMRLLGNLYHSNTEGLTLGAVIGGGGGLQSSSNHYVYTGSPSTGWHVSLGGSSGDYMLTNEYFDQIASAVMLRLTSAKGVITGCHFLAGSTSTATTCVRLSTANQEIVFSGNHLNANGSSLVSLFQTSAHSGTPTGGVYAGNLAFGTTGSFTGVICDSVPSAIGATSSATTYVAGNVICS